MKEDKVEESEPAITTPKDDEIDDDSDPNVTDTVEEVTPADAEDPEVLNQTLEKPNDNSENITSPTSEKEPRIIDLSPAITDDLITTISPNIDEETTHTEDSVTAQTEDEDGDDDDEEDDNNKDNEESDDDTTLATKNVVTGLDLLSQ